MKIYRIFTISILLIAILLAAVYFWISENGREQIQPAGGNQNGSSGSIQFSVPSGIYKGMVEVVIEGGPKEGTIHYTLDGTKPDRRSPVYKKPLTIREDTVVQAAVISGNALAETASATYLVEASTLPVFSIITDPENLWSKDKGIYITGVHASKKYPYKGANYWQDWEIPVEIDYLEKGKNVYSVSAGMKIFGGETRTLPQKSFALYAKSKYGSKKFYYPLFPGKNISEYNTFVLRNGGQDFSKTHLRDGLVSTLVKDTNIDYQEYRPVVVYLNGTYWGIYDLREKIDDDFLAANHPGVKKKKIDLLEGKAVEKQGSNQDYLDLIDFIKNNNLKNSVNYRRVSEEIDINNFIDYVVAELYFANTDWPSHNYRYWKANGNFSKWRWIIYDGDLTFGDPRENTVVRFVNYHESGDNSLTLPNLFRELLKNEQFRRDFRERADYHLANTFRPERVIETARTLKRQIQPEMPRHLEKWGGTMAEWEQNTAKIETFAKERPQHLKRYLDELYSNLK